MLPTTGNQLSFTPYTMTEGIAPFIVPGLAEPAKTWFKTFGDFSTNSTPLIVLHGGPGACHDYLLPLTDLNVPLVFYDQIGNGLSTHLPEKNGDEEFWSVDLFKDELDNLIGYLGLKDRPIDIYGHSWGGMLAAEWAVTESSSNLRRLIISNSLASMDTWRIGMDSLKAQLPSCIREVLDEAEKTENFTGPAYNNAIEYFYKRHLSLARPWPAPEVEAALNWFATDGTTYETMYVYRALRHDEPMYMTCVLMTTAIYRYGPSELYITGNLRNWTIIPELHKIKVPTLLINADMDEAQDVTMQPFSDNIKDSKWIKMKNAAHFSHVDKREEYIQHVQSFLI
jgi:proline-specific peptidase